MKNVIFVLGGRHCGTTLTATVLGANSKCMLIPMESGAYSIEHIRQLRQPFVRDVAKIDSEFVVEKSPNHVFQINKIQKDWPRSPIFVVTRNPIDSIASTFALHGDFNRAIYDCSNDLSACLYAMSRPNTFMVVYEHLVKNFEQVVKNMCQFADLEFEEEMLNFHLSSPLWFRKFLGDPLFQKRSQQMRIPIFDGSGKGKEVLTPEQIEKIKFDCMDKYTVACQYASSTI